MIASFPPSVRLFDGDFTLSLEELRAAEAEIIVALELDPPTTYKRALTELLVVARDLISHKTN
jgi:hypothetical protein